MSSVTSSTYDHKITGLAGVAVRVGAALEQWGRRSVPLSDRDVTERDELELRHWAENEAELTLAQKEAATNRELYNFIR